MYYIKYMSLLVRYRCVCIHKILSSPVLVEMYEMCVHAL